MVILRAPTVRRMPPSDRGPASGWQRLLPGPVADLDEDAVRELYRHPWPSPGRRAWVRANMVSSLDGAATDASGNTAGLSSPADRRLLVLLRESADVLLVGAGTVRVQRYRPSRTLIAVLTRTGDLDPTIPLLDPAAPGPPDRARPLVLTTPGVRPDRRRALARSAEVVPVGDAVSDALAALAGRGLRRVLTEGGPTLLAAVAGAGELDELCLTVRGQLLGTPAPRILDGPAVTPASPATFQPASVLRSGDDLYLRSTVRRPPEPSSPAD